MEIEREGMKTLTPSHFESRSIIPWREKRKTKDIKCNNKSGFVILNPGVYYICVNRSNLMYMFILPRSSVSCNLALYLESSTGFDW